MVPVLRRELPWECDSLSLSSSSSPARCLKLLAQQTLKQQQHSLPTHPSHLLVLPFLAQERPLSPTIISLLLGQHLGGDSLFPDRKFSLAQRTPSDNVAAVSPHLSNCLQRFVSIPLRGHVMVPSLRYHTACPSHFMRDPGPFSSAVLVDSTVNIHTRPNIYFSLPSHCISSFDNVGPFIIDDCFRITF